MSSGLDFDYASVPLLSSRHDIRLLSFPHRTSSNEPLRCNLEVFPLNDTPPFIALSYVWGHQQDQVEIQCNDDQQVLRITRNLHDALTRFAQDKYSRRPSVWTLLSKGWEVWSAVTWLWVDAVSIDQANPQEKGSQVLLMRYIYERATITCVWMGLNYPGNSVIPALVRYLLQSRRKYMAASESRKFWEMGYIDRAFTYSFPNIPSWPYWNVDSLVNQGWFTRAWIIQELIVSERPVLVFDRDALNWHDFRDAFAFMASTQMPMVDVRGTLRINQLDRLRDMAENGIGLRLLNLLMIARDFECKDERDRIYALLGLATDCGPNDMNILPDYTLSIDDLRHAVARKLLLQFNGLDLLRVPRVTNKTQKEAVLGLPSWVPTWRYHTEQWTTISAHGKHWDAAYSPFAAAPPRQLMEEDFSPDGHMLRLVGYDVEIIEEIGNEYRMPPPGESFGSKFLRVARDEPDTFEQWECICDVHSGQTYPLTEEPIRDAYWQTLISGQKVVFGWHQPQHFSFEDFERFHEAWDAQFRRPSRIMATANYRGVLRALIGGIAMFVTIMLMNLVSKSTRREAIRFTSALLNARGRRIFRSSTRCIGLAPAAARRGDVIFLVKGCRTPLVLRWDDSQTVLTLVGDCYFHGFMDAGFFEEAKCFVFSLS